jgi:ubiquinone/menaquinone biosynthesis C-methylase UbiE
MNIVERRAVCEEVIKSYCESGRDGEYDNFHGNRFYRELNQVNGSTLDLGCGDMRCAMHLKPSGLVGVDFSRDSIKLAKKTAGKSDVGLVLAAAECLPFRENSFENVILIETLKYAGRAYEDVLKEAKRVSQKNLVMSLDYKDLWSASSEKNNYKIQFDGNVTILEREGKEEEFAAFDEESLEKLMNKLELKIKKEKVFELWELMDVPIYEPWPWELPSSSTKSIIYIECEK